MRSNDYSRDETEFGAFGDTWGASVAPRPSGAAASVLFSTSALKPATAAQKASNPIAAAATKAAPAQTSVTRSTAAPAQTSVTRSGLGTLLPLSVNQNIVRATPSAAVSKLFAGIQAPAPKPAAPSSSSSGTDPRTLDFTTGQTTLDATGGVKAALVPLPVLTVAQQQAADAAKVRADAAKTSALNAQYRADRGAADRDTIRISNESQAYQRAHMSGADWGLLPLGAKVLATGAAVIGTAGAAGAAIAAGGITAASIGSVVTADGIVAAAADVGGKKAKDAKAIIDGTKALAASGNIDAQKGLATLAAVTADRAAKGVPPGVLQTPAQLSGLASNPVIQEATDGGSLDVADLSRRGDFTNSPLADAIAQTSSRLGPIKARGLSPLAAAAMPSVAPVLRWTIDSGGKIYRGATAPQLVGQVYRVYDSGQVERIG